MSDFLSTLQAFAGRGLFGMQYLVIFGATVGYVASLVALQLACARIVYQLANDGLLFKFLRHFDHETSTTRPSVLSCATLTALVAAFLDTKTLYLWLGMGTLVAYLFVALAVLCLRYGTQERLPFERHELFSRDSTFCGGSLALATGRSAWILAPSGGGGNVVDTQATTTAAGTGGFAAAMTRSISDYVLQRAHQRNSRALVREANGGGPILEAAGPSQYQSIHVHHPSSSYHPPPHHLHHNYGTINEPAKRMMAVELVNETTFNTMATSGSIGSNLSGCPNNGTTPGNGVFAHLNGLMGPRRLPTKTSARFVAGQSHLPSPSYS